MTAVGIDLDAIFPGDEVCLADSGGNTARGVVLSGRNGELLLAAFAAGLVFARPTRTGRMTMVHGLRLRDHQPQLFPVVP